MTDITADPATTQDEPPSWTTIHLLTPLAVLAATWAVRRVLFAGYQQATGHKPPMADDPSVRLSRVLLWAATTAAAGAVTEVVVYRLSRNIRTPER